MTNNDVLRRLRYCFDFSDDEMMELFELGEMPVTRAKISDWLKKEDDDFFVELVDVELAIFLNGLIIKNRGKRDGSPFMPETRLDNNIILKKLKIALSLTSDDIIDIFKKEDRTLTKTELSAFLRNPKQNQFRDFKDQYLRNFLTGIQKKYR